MVTWRRLPSGYKLNVLPDPITLSPARLPFFPSDEKNSALSSFHLIKLAQYFLTGFLDCALSHEPCNSHVAVAVCTFDILPSYKSGPTSSCELPDAGLSSEP